MPGKAIVREIRPNIDQIQAQDCKPRCVIFFKMPIARYILSTMMLTAAIGARAQEGGDTQARIDYAYQTEDGNSLANLIQNLTAQVQSDPGNIALRYHLAHAQYRLGELSHERHARESEAAFAD